MKVMEAGKTNGTCSILVHILLSLTFIVAPSSSALYTRTLIYLIGAQPSSPSAPESPSAYSLSSLHLPDPSREANIVVDLALHLAEPCHPQVSLYQSL